MKRIGLLIAVVALALACCFVGCSWTSGLVSTATEKLSPAIEKVKGLMPAAGGAGAGATGASDGSDGEADAGSDGWSLPSLGGVGLSAGTLDSTADIALVPTDDYGENYVFEYGGEEFSAYFDSTSWKVYDSYKITNHRVIVVICQALLDEHPVLGSDWESVRTADDMAFEWEQHNLAYTMLPADSHWRDDAKDVDLDPDDQGKTFQEIYESRTGREFDIRNYLPGE